MLVFYHGDGNMMQVVPDVVEMGIDVLNPVQPECMDPTEVKRRFGDRLALWGTLGTQTTLPFGSVAEVRETCRRLIREVGEGGGLLLAPTHVVEPEVPIENLVAFIDTVKEGGAV
jgi:uroporphyrinogen decarboxylase